MESGSETYKVLGKWKEFGCDTMFKLMMKARILLLKEFLQD